MAVQRDSAFQDGASGELTPFAFTSNAPASGTVAGTVAANANRVLIATFRARANSASIGTVGMTWNAVAMTQIGSLLDEPGSADVLALFGLMNPDTGDRELAATWTGLPLPPPDISIGAVALSAADQTTGWQNPTTATGTSATPSMTIASSNGNMVVALRGDDNSSGPQTVTAGSLDWNEPDLNGNDGASHRASVSASTVLSWTMASSVVWAMLGVDVIAAAAATVDELSAGRRSPALSVP